MATPGGSPPPQRRPPARQSHPTRTNKQQQQSSGVKSSTAITLGTLGVLSVLVVGFCAAQDDYEEIGADCVDSTSRSMDGSYLLVDESYCDDDDDDNHYRGSHGAYRWYYGGQRDGSRIRNGTTVRPADVQITTRSGRIVQRGGFGSNGGGGS